MKILELFSGIGGVHFAIKEIACHFDVVCALDINTTANVVYKHNFPNTLLMQNNVQSLQPRVVNDMGVTMLTMSPPCQPYTRQGNQKGEHDSRSDALSHILAILPELTHIQYIFLENVVGFEKSSSRDRLLQTLQQAQFRCQEFILTPSSFGIPNSRSRYYLLARKDPFSFAEEPNIRYELPTSTNNGILSLINKFSNSLDSFKIGNILDTDCPGELLPDKVLVKYGIILDIVTSDSKRSCCFTKGYSHYAEGTGSVYCPKDENCISQVFKKMVGLSKVDPDYLRDLKSLELRYFSPREVARLMCFPDAFTFPENVTSRQMYRLLGNSVNVHVVSMLIKFLIS